MSDSATQEQVLSKDGIEKIAIYFEILAEIEKVFRSPVKVNPA